MHFNIPKTYNLSFLTQYFWNYFSSKGEASWDTL